MIARTMKLRSLFALAALSLAATTGCSKPQEQPSPALVPTSIAKEATLAPTELLPGTIAPFQNVAITSSLAEPTLTVSVNEGDIVHRGEVLARLNTDDLQADYRQYIASAQGSGATTTHDIYTATQTITTSAQSLLSARAMLRQAQQTLANDSSNLKIDESLLQNGYVSQQSVTAQRTLVANDQQAVRSDQASLTSAVAARTAAGTMRKGVPASMIQAQEATQQEAYAQADQYRAQIARGTIVSPIDGIVVNRYLNPGEYPGTRQLFTIQQLNPAYAVFDASDAQLVGVKKGATVSFTTTDAPNHKYQARVVAILGQVE
ncbi:MAG: efflux RND transporter periplasmic adaptor subunit, partial [Candidatus Aquilonibacter sp.]